MWTTTPAYIQKPNNPMKGLVGMGHLTSDQTSKKSSVL